MTLLEQLPDVLSVAEVQRLLRISRNAAYECIRRGSIPSLRLGRTIRVPRAALERLLDGSTGETGGEREDT